MAEIRNTRQKNIIMQCLKDSKVHITFDELYLRAKEKDSKIGIATIYRNLKSLEEQGLINKVLLKEGCPPCYELCTDDLTHKHHHLICKKCGIVLDFEDDLLEAIEKIIEVTKGFTISDHRVVFYGLCRNCQTN